MLPGTQSGESGQEQQYDWQNYYASQNNQEKPQGYSHDQQYYQHTNIQNNQTYQNTDQYPQYGSQYQPMQAQQVDNQYINQSQSHNFSGGQSLDQYSSQLLAQATTEPSPSDQATTQTIDRPQKKKQRDSVKKAPQHNFKKTRQNRLYDRPSSRNSIASEISSYQFSNIDDDYIKWYQMVTNYYKLYYPDYKIQDIRHINQADIGAYCYQLYMQAHRMSMPMMMPGYEAKQVPYLYMRPHLRVNLHLPGLVLLILPTRPADGQPSRLELISVEDIANDAIANAGIRASELVLQERKEQEASQNFENSMYAASSTNDSTGGGMSIQMDNFTMNDLGSEEYKAREAKFYADITVTWDRVDNEFFPGPLCTKNSLKLDLLAFLKEKMNDIEDRMPIDWESIVLYIKFMEIMIKNNGMLHMSEICQLLLEGQEKKDLAADHSQLITNSMSFCGVQQSQQKFNQSSVNQSYDNQPQQIPGEEMTTSLNQPRIKRSDSVASSSLSEIQLNQNAGNLNSLLRKIALKTDRSRDNSALEKFRQLLMSGLTMKAVEYACKAKLWGHAFALAYQLSDPSFPQNDVNLLQRVTKLFIANSIVPTDPIASLYQTLGNEQPQIINSISFSAGADLNEWRPHVAMLLSAKSYRSALVIKSIEQLGDSLLAKKLTFASHICYLISEQLTLETCPDFETKWAEDQRPLANWSRLPGKIWLIGSSQLPGDFSPFNFDQAIEFNGSERSTSEDYEDIGIYPTECVQFTEIYEYCLKLRMINSNQFLGTNLLSRININRNFIFVHLLPYKLAYAVRLLDAGIVESAYRYLLVCADGLVKFLLTISQQPCSPYSLQSFTLPGGIFESRMLINIYHTCDTIINLLLKIQSYPDLEWIAFMDQVDEENGYRRPLSQTVTEPILVSALKMIHNELSRALNLPVCWPGQVPPCDEMLNRDLEDNLRNMNLSAPIAPMATLTPTPKSNVQENLPKKVIKQESEVQLRQNTFMEKTPVNSSSPVYNQPESPQPPAQSNTNPTNGFFNPSVDNAASSGQAEPFDFFSHVVTQPAPVTPRSRNPSTSSHLSGGSRQQRFSFSDENNRFDNSSMTSTPSVSMALPRVEESNNLPPNSSSKPFTTPSLTQQFNSMPNTSNSNRQPDNNFSSNKQTTSQADSKPTENTAQKTGEENNEKNDGWFGGIMSKLKKKSYLPDDSKSTIIYDEKLKKWIDTSEPNGGDDCPIPPPANPAMIAAKTEPIQPRLQQNNGLSFVPPSLPNGSSGYAKTRSRYVNVLQDSGLTKGPTPGDIPIPP